MRCCPAWQGRSSAFPVIFAAAFFELCTHCCKPVLEDIDDGFADLGRRKGGSVYEPTPTIDFIFGADDHFIGVAIHPDKALGFLNPSHQIVDAHGLGLHWRPQRSKLAPFTPKAPQGFDPGCRLAPADHRTGACGSTVRVSLPVPRPMVRN